MFLRSNTRKKDGKDHRYFSIVENHRIACGKTVQRTLRPRNTLDSKLNRREFLQRGAAVTIAYDQLARLLAQPQAA